ncbi:cation:proton antiporter [Aeromicrobium sp. CTD01-1L150]|uniref:cation:proton antiporter n=1 Tax=Aeromicrobium sp. CTD01-1L150 TaxID=3341830 RepID=UPI0035C224E4
MVLDVLGQVLVVIGALVFVVAAIGLITLFDPYTRTSAVATAAGVGVSLVVTGVVLLDPSLPTVVKAVFAILLQLATSAIGGMAIARSAVLSGHTFEHGTDTVALDVLHDDEE